LNIEDWLEAFLLRSFCQAYKPKSDPFRVAFLDGSFTSVGSPSDYVKCRVFMRARPSKIFGRKACRLYLIGASAWPGNFQKEGHFAQREHIHISR
jgi:hypothetical protein